MIRVHVLALKCKYLGIHVQKKKGINMNWNEELLSPLRPAIDQAFRTILDDSCETFKAEAAQTIKSTLSDLDNTLKGRFVHQVTAVSTTSDLL
jgi:hypothetical protein